jgi:hypothetical protein
MKEIIIVIITIIICDNGKETCLLMDIEISGNKNVIEKEAERFCNIKADNRNAAYVECRNKGDTSNNGGNWNRLKINQKIPEEHAGKS